MLIPASGMALPIVKSLTDCADYSKTIEPYIPQLAALPSNLYAAASSTDSLQHLYASTNPAISGLAFSLALFPIFLVVSEVNKNYSQVDRVWSILPTLYNAHFAIWGRVNGLPTQKVDNVLEFSVIWTMRLTYNYWRKGGYQIGSEDYRWALIKKQIGQPWFFILNVLFVSSLQSVLLFSVTLPTYILLLTSRLSPTMTLLDTVFARALMVLVVVEWFADGSQWNYHAAKLSYQQTAKVPAGYTRAQLDRGFNTTGMWKHSRHPNFAAEQAIWLILYQWACVDSHSLWNWTVGGVIAYLGVFAGSTPLTERISAGKYPEYRVYQERVGKFVPKLFGKRWDEREMERMAATKKQ
ncbi:hypothetical protein LTR91_013587 [Friedmanniomyces endolithicus]|uniref:Steroid 5-alpha reductase C-terminal domain-containing protein n=1 Tax=Friedmanniomyces endolithicus TaxID=329885 RepID=A0AAN6KDJ0_9PEZI|nr:hypothetical protein LTR57_014016 [Friedmanniomyces endolithicus]KAK0976746.1 hypothetical protein LTR91_013587 [Friedmanniomyces endolithicus]KAK1007167.1 hypothetical protein LTS01_002861 [Friedmanniomyces endolithicus]KAK1029329.1 hypothetical protein LTS16_019817 [Friedmanniomyces endolithicus]